MKIFSVPFSWLCVLSISLASTPTWKTPDETIAWLQTKEELNTSEYTNVSRAWAHFENESHLEESKDQLGVDLIDELAFRRFSKLRNARDLAGVTEFFESHSDSSLKRGMISALSDGRDDEFAARIVHHALVTKNWADPKASISNLPLRRNLFSKLVGGPEKLERIGSDFSLEEQQAMKLALEEKWPILLEHPETPRETTLPGQEIREGDDSGDKSHQNGSGNLVSKLFKWNRSWLVGVLALLAAVGAAIFVKIRRSAGN